MFNGDSNTMQEETISQEVLFPWPIFTKNIRIVVTDGAKNIVLGLDFIGETSERQYELEKNLAKESGRSFSYGDLSFTLLTYSLSTLN